MPNAEHRQVGDTWTAADGSVWKVVRAVGFVERWNRWERLRRVPAWRRLLAHSALTFSLVCAMLDLATVIVVLIRPDTFAATNIPASETIIGGLCGIAVWGSLIVALSRWLRATTARR